MRKKCRLVVSIISICVVFITGCKPMSNKTGVDNEFESLIKEFKTIAPNEVDSHITINISEKFSMDADIIISDELETYSVENLKMKRHLFTDKEILLKKIIEEFRWKQENLTDIQFRLLDDTLENGEKETVLSIEDESENSGYAYVRDRYVTVDNELGRQYGAWSISAYSEINIEPDMCYLEEMKEEISLDFLSVEKVKDYASKLVKDFEIDFWVDSTVYTCTLEKLQNVMEREHRFYIENGWDDEIRREVNKDDEAYFVTMQQGNKGISFFPYNVSKEVSNSYLVGNQCCIIYSKDGIEDLYISNMYDIIDTVEKKEIISLGDLLEIYYNQYGNTLATREEIIKIQLYYLPICTDEMNLEFTAKPIWYVLSNVERDMAGEKTIQRRAVMYDAATGEEIKWEE